MNVGTGMFKLLQKYPFQNVVITSIIFQLVNDDLLCWHMYFVETAEFKLSSSVVSLWKIIQ